MAVPLARALDTAIPMPAVIEAMREETDARRQALAAARAATTARPPRPTLPQRAGAFLRRVAHRVAEQAAALGSRHPRL